MKYLLLFIFPIYLNAQDLDTRTQSIGAVQSKKPSGFTQVQSNKQEDETIDKNPEIDNTDYTNSKLPDSTIDVYKRQLHWFATATHLQ